MIRYKFIAITILLIIVCGCLPNFPPANNTMLEDISSYNYERLLGHNAAISQFGAGNEDLFVNLDNKRVVSYVANEGNIDNAYADGYHNALDLIQRRIGPSCPDIH